MEIIIVQLLLSLFGFGLQASNYIDAHKPTTPSGFCVRANDYSPLQKGGELTEYELNDVPGNVTLQIDGYEIAYPIRTEILGASGLSVDRGQLPATASRQPSTENNQPSTDIPRYYILAEPIMFRRAGDSEWRSFYKAYPPSTPMTTDENIQAEESVSSVTSVDNILSSKKQGD